VLKILKFEVEAPGVKPWDAIKTIYGGGLV